MFLRNCSRQQARAGNRRLEKTAVKADRLRHRAVERKVEGRREELPDWDQLERIEPSRVGG